MESIRLEALEFASVGGAIQHTEAAWTGEAILCGDRYLVVSKRDAERLHSEGVEFAYLYDCEGRILTVPVN